MRSFKQYKEDRETQDTNSQPTQPGEEQVDPNKPQKMNDLSSALEEIVAIANKALDLKTKGLGDMRGKPNEDQPEDGNMNKTIARPSPDNAEGMFGNGDQ